MNKNYSIKKRMFNKVVLIDKLGKEKVVIGNQKDFLKYEVLNDDNVYIITKELDLTGQKQTVISFYDFSNLTPYVNKYYVVDKIEQMGDLFVLYFQNQVVIYNWLTKQEISGYYQNVHLVGDYVVADEILSLKDSYLSDKITNIYKLNNLQFIGLYSELQGEFIMKNHKCDERQFKEEVCLKEMEKLSIQADLKKEEAFQRVLRAKF